MESGWAVLHGKVQDGLGILQMNADWFTTQIQETQKEFQEISETVAMSSAINSRCPFRGPTNPPDNSVSANKFSLESPVKNKEKIYSSAH